MNDIARMFENLGFEITDLYYENEFSGEYVNPERIKLHIINTQKNLDYFIKHPGLEKKM